MTLEIRQFPCLTDNYGYLVRDVASGRTAAVDAPDADAILKDLEASGWGRLDMILNTHWHPDHTQGAERLRAETRCTVAGPAESARAVALDRTLREGDRVELGQTVFTVMETPGHTLGHIVFLDQAGENAFVGDTLFALGCGRLFEGTPGQMWDSLNRLARLPDATRVWCAHEYTAANARFALSLSDAPELRAHAEAVFAAREQGRPTVPTVLGVEKALNPFLTAADAAEFAARRAAKDSFAG